jgi:PilZ domain
VRRFSEAYKRDMTIEKRIEAREPVKLPVTLADGNTGTTRDVSVTGLFFEIDNKLELGSVVDFSIELSANGRSMLLTGQGEVVRIEARGTRTGAALRMLDSHLEAAD